MPTDFFFFFKTICFRVVVGEQKHWEGTEVFFVLPDPPPTCIASPLSPSPTTVGHLLWLMNLHWCIVVTQSPWFPLWFTSDAGCSVGLDPYIMTCSHCYSVIQSIFPVLKTLCALCFFPQPLATLPPTPGNWGSFWFLWFCLPSVVTSIPEILMFSQVRKYQM